MEVDKDVYFRRDDEFLKEALTKYINKITQRIAYLRENYGECYRVLNYEDDFLFYNEQLNKLLNG